MDLISVIQWLVPSGALGAVIGWFLNVKLRDARQAKEVHETYKVLYDNIKSTLIELQDENKKLYKMVAKLENAIVSAQSCRYFNICPINTRLRDKKNNLDAKECARQRNNTSGEGGALYACAKGDGDIDAAGDEPP